MTKRLDVSVHAVQVKSNKPEVQHHWLQSCTGREHFSIPESSALGHELAASKTSLPFTSTPTNKAYNQLFEIFVSAVSN